MSEPSADRDPFEGVAESFLARFRAGERPSIAEYAARHPELADQIRKLLPALVMVEQELSIDDDEAPAARAAIGGRPWRLGDYRILGEIGRGGMGVVYEAEQISLGRRVALKVLPGRLAHDATALERFRREAKSAARLHHTNIVPVFEVGQDGEMAYYAMQFIEGQGLNQIIDELARLRDDGRIRAAEDAGRTAFAGADGPRQPAIGPVAASLLTGRLAPEGADSSPTATTDPAATERLGPAARSETAGAGSGLDDYLPAPAPAPPSSVVFPGGAPIDTTAVSGRRSPYFRGVAQIGRQAAQGLAYAHARGIVHRDIKPSNLLLDHAGVVWITDFGLAKTEEDGLTATGDILGTFRYMAPERFRGQGDARADVYALGLTLYELLTLRSAYDSSDRLKLIEQVKTEEPVRPRSIDRHIPRDLETIVLKAIEKEPRARYQSADAMAEDLRRFLADEPIRARQVSTSERYWRWARRNPVIATLGGVLTAVLIAVTIGSMLAAARYEMIARSERQANAQSQLARTDAIAARRQAFTERDHSRLVSASLTLEKGIAIAEQGFADRSLHWMLEAQRIAPEDALDFRRTVRWNLGAWLGQVHKPLRFIDTGGPCEYLAFSPDGRSFVTGFRSPDHASARPIDLWDTASGRKVSSLPETFAPVAFQADGRVVFAYADAWRLKAVDLATRGVLWTAPRLAGDWGERIDVSPDGCTVFASRRDKQDRGNAWLLPLDAATGRGRGEPIKGSGVMAVAPDGKAVATFRIESGEAYIDVHELPSGWRQSSWPIGKVDVSKLHFSPDQKSLFSVATKGDGYDLKSYFGQTWGTTTRGPAGALMGQTNDVIYAPAADRLVTQGDGLLLRDTATGRVRGAPFALGGGVSHPDGRTMLTNGRGGWIHLWQVSEEAEPVSDGATENRTRSTGNEPNRENRGMLAFLSSLRADGQIAVSLSKSVAGRELVRMTDPVAGRPVGRPVSHQIGWIIGAVAFSPDGRLFATGSNPDGRLAGEVRLWEASTGRLRLPAMLHTNYLRALAFRPDGKVLAAGDYHGLVRFWDTSTGREIGRPLPQRELVLALAFSPDGKMLAVGLGEDFSHKPGTRLWDAVTGRPIGELLPCVVGVHRIEFRPDGRAFLAGAGGSTRLWDAVLAQAMGEEIIDDQAVGFRPDGRVFLTLGKEGSVKVRDGTTGKALARLMTASSAPTCAVFRGDGGLVAAGFEDGTVRLCDPATNEPVGPPRSMRHAVRHVAFLPDGRSIAAIDEFGESRTWPVPEPLEDASLDDLTLRVEARTGLRMEAGLSFSRLGTADWSERIEQLRRLDSTAVEPDADPAWHGPMVLEAEQNGHAFAAIWHLDRLIAARPADWLLYARRARAWSLSDRLDKSAADYGEAERLGKRDDVLDFQTHCVVDCTKAERWAEALWYLDRLIAARPDDGFLHEDRAAVYGKLGREAERQAELARVYALGADEGLVIARAEELGRGGRWAEAAGLLARCGRTGPLSPVLAQAWGIACLRADDHAGYREGCAALMAYQGADPTVVWNALPAASFFALGAEGLDDYRVPMQWFESRLSAAGVLNPVIKHYFSNVLGGLLLRAGRLDEAIARVNEGIAAAKQIELPTDWAYLALAHAHKRNLAEARRWHVRLCASPPASFWDVQEVAVLRSEVESLLFDAGFPSDPFRGSGAR
jgi:eukaryotic-like serine/threonine-protein kinase